MIFNAKVFKKETEMLKETILFWQLHVYLTTINKGKEEKSLHFVSLEKRKLQINFDFNHI